MSSSDPRLAALFRDEAEEHLDALESSLLAFERGTATKENLAECLRRTHTLKGAARAVGERSIQDGAHAIETDLLPHREAGALPPETIRNSLARIDLLRARLAPAPVPPGGPAKESASAPPQGPQTPTDPELPEEMGGEILRVEADRLDRMMRLLGTLRVGRGAGRHSFRAEIRALVGIFREAEATLEEAVEKARENPLAARDRIEEARRTIRSATERLDAARSAHARRITDENLTLDQLDKELRATRLVPLGTLSLTLERAVQDLARAKGLEARFQIVGTDVSLDRAVLEVLREPLLHLVRNCVAHGIEPPDERRAGGKPPFGTIRIEATRAGNWVRLVVSDDGRGVDLRRLRMSLSQVGILADDIAKMPEQEILDLLFQPEVSTAAEADEISGRGLGLEIVRTRLRAAQGDARLVETGSTGTRFELRLPLHLQVLRLVLLRAGTSLFGVPTAAVLRSGRAGRDDIRILEGTPTLPTPEGPIPYYALETILAGSPERAGGGGEYVVLAGAGRQVAVGVDEIADESEVLLRNLGFPLQSLRHVSGAGLSSASHVILVLHPGELLETALHLPAPEAPKGDTTRRKVLVVDDSPTTRSIVRGVFAAAGFEVAVASDGFEALRHFEARGADIVVSDVDMPRMNGIALTRAIKAASGGKTPVVLVTARESEDDKKEGMLAGADAYLVKSAFEGASLLETVKRFL